MREDHETHLQGLEGSGHHLGDVVLHALQQSVSQESRVQILLLLTNTQPVRQ